MFLNLNTQKSHLESLWKQIAGSYPQSFWFGRSGVRLENILSSNSLPGDTGAVLDIWKTTLENTDVEDLCCFQFHPTFYFLVTASLSVPPTSFGKLLLSYSSHSILVFLPVFIHVWLHTERYIYIENHFLRNNKMVAVRGWGLGGIGDVGQRVCVCISHSFVSHSLRSHGL